MDTKQLIIQNIEANQFEDFDNHEIVVKGIDEATGLTALIAVHNRNLGPALGGCRMHAYADEAQAVTDVLRLSKGMTYKSALAELPLGGGKAVIIGDPKMHKTPELLRSMGAFIDSLNGLYISAEDSGTGVSDLQEMNKVTEHIAGITQRVLDDGSTANGDPSPATAYGVFIGIKASLLHRFKSASVDGAKIAVQGVGNVGRNLVRLLVQEGAVVYISDAYEPAIERVLAELSEYKARIHIVDNNEIHQLKVEVYAPCALGGALNTSTLVELHAPIVAGAANNQLANDGAGQYLFHKGTLYAPDFAINAGGIIDIFYERQSQHAVTAKPYEHKNVLRHIDRIGDTLTQVFELSEQRQSPTHITAEKLGEARFMGLDIEDVA